MSAPKAKRVGAVTCVNCQYFKEQNKDRTGLCLIVDHYKLPAWIERSACIVGHDETCDIGKPKAVELPPTLPPQGFVL